MIGLVIGGVVIVLVGWFVISRGRKYSRLFSDEHVQEVANAIVKLKAAALAKIIHDERDEPASADDPRLLQTSAGLNVIYTVRSEDGQYVHHCSVSIANYTAHAAGGTFVVLLAMLVQLPIEKMSFLIAESTVHHGNVALDPDEHAKVAAAPVEIPPALELRRRAFETRAKLTWQRGPGLSNVA